MELVSTGSGHGDGVNLTPAEIRLLSAFRWLNSEQQALYFDAICDCASEQQLIAKAKKPALRVVMGAAK